MAEGNTQDPLEVVANKIAAHAKKADEQVIKAALLMREARRRVEAGEAGDVTWYAWGRKNIDLSETRLRELQRIADADDPAAEIERLRKMIRKRVEEHRARKAAEAQSLDEERKELITWAKKAPIERVRRVLKQVNSKADDAPIALIEAPEATEGQQAA